MENTSRTKITFYVDFEARTVLELFKDEIHKLEKLGIPVSFHEQRDAYLPEACINGYCVAGVDDIKHEINSLIHA